MARPGLLQHKKFRRVERALDVVVCKGTRVRGLGRCIALGCLEMIWAGAYESGDDVIGTPEDVEAAASWNGPAGVLFAALRDAGAPEGGPGFIEPAPGLENVWRIHDLWHHAPDYVAKRAAREAERIARGDSLGSVRSRAGKKGAEKRWQPDGKCPPLAMPEDGNGMANGLPPAPSPAPAPSPEKQQRPARELGRRLDGKSDAEEHPETARLIAWLAARGVEAVYARKPQDRAAVEAALAAVTVEAAGPAVEASILETGKPWLGWHVDAIRRAAAPKPKHSETLDPAWLDTLPANERERAEAEWAETCAGLKRAAYPDALPRMLAAARDDIMARYGGGTEAA